jgi:hypothetical protein
MLQLLTHRELPPKVHNEKEGCIGRETGLDVLMNRKIMSPVSQHTIPASQAAIYRIMASYFSGSKFLKKIM